MKKLIGIILSVCMILSVCAVPVLAEDTIKVTVDGKLVDCAAYGQEPVAIDGTTLVPLRSVFEELGATVAWDGETQSVVSFRDDLSILLVLNSKEMVVSGEVKTLSVPAQSMNDRIMVPVRAIAEAFGCDVKWDGDTRTVVVSTFVQSDETPEDVVKIVYDSVYKFDFETPRKYFIDEESADFYLGEMSIDQALDSIPGIEFEGRMKEIMINYVKDIFCLTSYEVKNVVYDGEFAWVDVEITAPDEEQMQLSDIEISEEEEMRLTMKALEKCGLTMEEVENTTDPEVQENFMYAVMEVSFDYVIEVAQKGMQEGKVLKETIPVELQKINGRWLIVE